MKLKKIICALFFMFTFPAVAADKGTLTIPTTAVTGNPLGVGSDQMVVPISILNGRELSLKRENTLAETLNSIPGVSNSSFGPSVGRPMIRGMDSDRVKILQNGVNNLDASNLSFDHGVSIDPLIIEQIDVIRGPATLLYGGGAVGGVVNAIDHRIPKEKLQGITGRGEVRYGGANLEQSNAAVVDVGTGNFVMHFDAYSRDSKNLRIPGNAISNRLESTNYWNPDAGDGGGAADTDPKTGDYVSYTKAHGRNKLLNSQSETRGGAVGASMIFDRGYAGVSYAKHQTKYGSVKEPGILLDMDTDRIDFASEIRDLGSFFEKAKFKAAYTDYRHHEMDAVTIHTTFKNKGIDGTFELMHVPLLGLKGVIGTQFDSGKFDAIGDEAFIPNSKTNSQSVYLYEELPLNQHKVTFGLRHGKHEVESKGGEPDEHGHNKFGAPSRKKFNTNNAAIGGLYKLNEQWSLTGNLSHNERAPSYFELFANGVHAATGVFEQGQSNLKKEKSNGIDGQIRWKSGQDSLTFGAYFNRFSNFNGLLSTPLIEVAEVHHEGGDPEYITYKTSRFTGIKAEFKGVELEGKTMLTDYLQFNVRGDYVDAKDKTNGGYVPRISPLKLGAGLKYEFNRFGARLDVLHAFKQDRVASNYNYQGGKELMTDAYTNVSMMATYKLPTQLNLEAFTRANNLLDEEIREHTSFLKDIAPMGGRSIMFGTSRRILAEKI
jgi:iron complex outermembrane recepter protein